MRPNEIKLKSELNEERAVFIFTIEMPSYLLINKNFPEVLNSYQLLDPSSWLIALGQFIRDVTQRKENG